MRILEVALTSVDRTAKAFASRIYWDGHVAGWPSRLRAPRSQADFAIDAKARDSEAKPLGAQNCASAVSSAALAVREARRPASWKNEAWLLDPSRACVRIASASPPGRRPQPPGCGAAADESLALLARTHRPYFFFMVDQPLGLDCFRTLQPSACRTSFTALGGLRVELELFR
jgi:hypothetical protein